MKAAFFTLGCKVNQYETQQMTDILRKKGYEIVSAREKADVVVVNSCTVTEESSRKSKKMVRHFRTLNPGAAIVLTGCYPQAFTEEAAKVSEADIILGNGSNYRLAEALDVFFESKNRQLLTSPHGRTDPYRGSFVTGFDGHTRAFVKIQDGCNRYCSYCVIPRARGFSRSRTLGDIQKELSLLAEAGFKEVVFVGINLSAYGMDTGHKLTDALRLAENTAGIERIRLGSLEPDHITDDIIAGMAEMSKFCPQFHLSLQSGCDEVLKRMNRHYDTAEYSQLCGKLKASFKDISLTTDVICGFPGETEEQFAESAAFVAATGFMKVHVFPFSPRSGTRAYDMPQQIPESVKNDRCRRLQEQCDRVREEFLNGYVGKTVSVLFETPKAGRQRGYTANYTPVSVISGEILTDRILPVRVTGVSGGECFGELV